MYISEGVIVDLKQFIAGAITQQTADIHLDMTGMRQDITSIQQGISGMKQDIQRLDQNMQKLDRKVDEGFASIAEILEDMNARSETHGVLLKDHDQRLTRLEQHTT